MTDNITKEEFIHEAETNKVALIERIAGKMLETGYELATAAFEYYGLEAVTPTKTEDAKSTEAYEARGRLAVARARRAKLDTEYDALKHGLSALQSTLRFERELEQR